MSSIKIPYRKINFLSPLVQDYLSESAKLSSFYGRYNTIDNFYNQMEEKSQFPIDRKNLVDVLKKQNQAIDLSDLTQSNIESLESIRHFYNNYRSSVVCFYRAFVFYI